MKLSGLIAAPHTPFNPDYSINLDAVAKQAAHLAEKQAALLWLERQANVIH